MDKQIQQFFTGNKEPYIEDELEIFIVDLVKVIVGFSQDPNSLILSNFNKNFQDHTDLKPELQEITQLSQIFKTGLGDSYRIRPDQLKQIQSKTNLKALNGEVDFGLLARRSDKASTPKFDFKVEKSSLSISKSIQDLPHYNNAQYIAAVGTHYYLVSQFGGPVTLISQYSSQHIKLETGQLGCQAHAVSRDLLAIGCNTTVLIFELTTLKVISIIPLQGVVTEICFISNYIFVASDCSVKIFFYTQRDEAPTYLQNEQLTQLGKINSIKPGSIAGDFIMASSKCLLIAKIDLISHKITSLAITLIDEQVLDCEECDNNIDRRYAAIVANRGRDQNGQLTLYIVSRRNKEDDLVSKVLCKLTQTEPQIDFKLKRAFKSNILLTILDDQVFAIDTNTGRVTSVFQENRLGVDCERFYDWSIRDSSVRLLLLCKHKGLVFVHKVDFDSNAFVKGLQALLNQ